MELLFTFSAISETKLNDNFLDDKIRVYDYVSYRLDSQQTFAGELFCMIHNMSLFELRCLWINLKANFFSMKSSPPHKSIRLKPIAENWT